MENKLHVITAPEDDLERNEISIFLAGTIDNSDSIDWQSELCDELEKDSYLVKNLTIFNPRREYWNMDATNEELEEQIKWELHHLEEAKYIIMCILGNSKSPITLLEMGLFMRQRKLIVFCPEDFYRSTNVYVTCGLYNTPVYKTDKVDDIVKLIRNLVK